MSKILDFSIAGQHIEWDTAPTLVAGTVNEYTARFSFNGDWDGYQRIAVFSADGVEREQLLTNDACDVPWEVLRPGAYLKVGVYGTRDGSRLPTIWTAHRQYIHDGAGPTEEAADPSPVLAEQMLQRMGDLGQLKTEDKSSLVAAINEVKETGSGGGTSDHSKLTNRDAADQHPMSAITGLEDALAGKQPAGDYLTEEQDPTVPEWAKQPQKPAYTAQEVGALPDTTKIPSALSELSEDATHRVVTDAEKAAWNAKSNFTGSYNDLTDKPVIPTVPVQSVNGKTGAVVLSADDVGALPASTVIPDPYTLPIASSTVLGGVKPVAKTAEMTESVGVDEAGGLFTAPGSGGGVGWHAIGDQVMDGAETAVAFDCNDECILMISILGLTEVMGATKVVLSLVHQSGKSNNFYEYTLNSSKFSPKNTFLIYGKSRNRAMFAIKGESMGYSGTLTGSVEQGTAMDENYKFDPVTSVVVTFNSAPVSGVRVVVEGM